MKRPCFSLLSSLILSAIALSHSAQIVWPQESQIERQENAPRFRYDFQVGKCLDGNNNIGFNNFILEQVKGTKNAECYDLKGIDLIDLKENITEENRLAYNKLKSWNFRGSSLDGAELFFNHLVDADLRGSRFSNLEFGYANISGTVDNFSEIPETCERTKDLIGCYS